MGRAAVLAILRGSGDYWSRCKGSLSDKSGSSVCFVASRLPELQLGSTASYGLFSLAVVLLEGEVVIFLWRARKGLVFFLPNFKK